ncbi:hypothetical protein J132_01358, partial [Termitomyces sp. J132]
SFDQFKQQIAQIGISPIIYDMCIKSCLACTGPFSDNLQCWHCGKPCFDPICQNLTIIVSLVVITMRFFLTLYIQLIKPTIITVSSLLRLIKPSKNISFNVLINLADLLLGLCREILTMHVQLTQSQPGPKKKINSGYKAWEYLYIFALAPGLDVCFIHQQWIHSTTQLVAAHTYLIEYIAEFESLYIQHRADRIHFVWPIIHTLTHLPTKILCIGPGIVSSQWKMKQKMGSLTGEIKQDSNPYANLSCCAMEHAEVVCLKAMFPELDSLCGNQIDLFRGTKDVGDGYVCVTSSC